MVSERHFGPARLEGLAKILMLPGELADTAGTGPGPPCGTPAAGATGFALLALLPARDLLTICSVAALTTISRGVQPTFLP